MATGRDQLEMKRPTTPREAVHFRLKNTRRHVRRVRVASVAGSKAMASRSGFGRFRLGAD